MTTHEDSDIEVRYEGSHDADPNEGRLEAWASPEFEPPDRAPETCSLCSAEEPQYWYALEPPQDPAAAPSTSSIRWWAICDVCHQLIAAIETLRDRVVSSGDRKTFKLLPEFIDRAALFSDIESS